MSRNLPGARSGGLTHHIQGPHLIPNVGREAMLGAEVVRRKPKAPKAKAKVEPKIQVKKAQMKEIPWVGLGEWFGGKTFWAVLRFTC